MRPNLDDAPTRYGPRGQATRLPVRTLRQVSLMSGSLFFRYRKVIRLPAVIGSVRSSVTVEPAARVTRGTFYAGAHQHA